MLSSTPLPITSHHHLSLIFSSTDSDSLPKRDLCVYACVSSDVAPVLSQKHNLLAGMFIASHYGGALMWTIMTTMSKIRLGKNFDVIHDTGKLRRGGGTPIIGKCLSRFLKPQSGTEEGLLQLSHHISLRVMTKLWGSNCRWLWWALQHKSFRGRKTNCAFNHETVGPWCGLMVAFDYGFKNPAQVHLEYKIIFS